jgi:hypothetical protein
VDAVTEAYIRRIMVIRCGVDDAAIIPVRFRTPSLNTRHRLPVRPVRTVKGRWNGGCSPGTPTVYRTEYAASRSVTCRRATGKTRGDRGEDRWLARRVDPRELWRIATAG